MSNNLEVLGVESFDTLIKFLNNNGIETELVDKSEHGYSRTIEFVVDEQVYNIVWYKNESKLKIGKSLRSPFVMFKYIYLNNTMPIIGGNKNLGFSFTKKVKTNMFDDEFNYSDFRIPLWLGENNEPIIQTLPLW